MTSVALAPRNTTAVSFNRTLEHLLLNIPSPHSSLTEDIELCATLGLELVSELREVTEIKHVPQIQKLVQLTNYFTNMAALEFDTWHIEVSEDIVDEIELIILTHGNDLKELGLTNASVGTVLILLVVSGLLHPTLIAANRHEMAQLAQLY